MLRASALYRADLRGETWAPPCGFCIPITGRSPSGHFVVQPISGYTIVAPTPLVLFLDSLPPAFAIKIQH